MRDLGGPSERHAPEVRRSGARVSRSIKFKLTRYASIYNRDEYASRGQVKPFPYDREPLFRGVKAKRRRAAALQSGLRPHKSEPQTPHRFGQGVACIHLVSFSTARSSS